MVIKKGKRPRAGRILLSVLIGSAALLVFSASINALITKAEKKKSSAPGKMIRIDGKELHVAVLGDGEKTIILMPGHGDPSPYYDFLPLAERLAERFTVAIFEPFGYGWSDRTSSERTSENIVREMRTALQAAGIDPPYVLVPHSISGLYALEYATTYPEEIAGVVCLDTSVPEQMRHLKRSRLSAVFDGKRAYRALNALGLIRLGMSIAPGLNPVDLSTYDEENRKMQLMFAYWNLYNTTVIEEADLMARNAEGLEGAVFPRSFPTLMILSDRTVENVARRKVAFKWDEGHERILGDHPGSEIVILPGGHYIYRGNEERIAGIIEDRF